MSVCELVDVLRRVLPHHTQEDDGLRTVLTLAAAAVCDSESATPEIALVAWPDRDHYADGLGPDQGLWEQGHCGHCDIGVTSNAKRAYCPVCGFRVGLT